MDDGQMGSIRVVSPPPREPIDGEKASDILFMDTDGVAVLASLYLDANARPAELAIWKTDFSPLLAIPEGFDAGND